MKRILTFCVCLVTMLTLPAQNVVMKVKLSNGQLVSYTASEVDSIYFERGAIENEPRYVDLGLTSGLCWASFDYLAKDSITSGPVYIWNNFDTNDIVYNEWSKYYAGNQWRMPTKDDFQELVDECTWSKFSTDEGKEIGWKVISKKNSNFIILPYRDYWTKTSYNSEMAWYLKASSAEETAELKKEDTTKKLVIRPVWGETAIAATVVTGKATFTTTTATIPLSVISDDDIVVESYGIYYSTSSDMSGKKTAYGTGTLTKGTAATVSLAGLTANTKYYYQGFVKLKSVSNPYVSVTANETTLAKSLTVEATTSNLTFSGVTLNITLTGNSQEDVTYVVSLAKGEEDFDTAKEGTVTLTPNTDKVVTVDLSDLTAEQTYKYQVTAKYSDFTATPSTGTFTTPAESDFPMPTAVDLGLSVKWANFNLGAASAAEYGGLYGWGDATGEETSENEFNYGYYIDEEGTKRYLMNTHIGGNADFDLATAKLGKGWRMPTPKEIEELNQCTRTYVSNYEGSGISGYTFTNNGNSIFIPHAGFKSSPSAEATDVNFYGYIWSDSIASTTAIRYKIMDGAFATQNPAYKTRFSSIRPVYDDGTSPGGGGGGSIDTDLTKVVSSLSTDATGSIPLAGVDMGTTVYGQKVYWSRWNIGAILETDEKGKITEQRGQYGRYYAWGDKETKDSYTSDTYTVNFKDMMPDELDFELPDSADVVKHLWGGYWRMPSAEDFTELVNQCDVEWTTEGGLYGYKFTSLTTGNSIFLPAGGYKRESSTTSLGSNGYYWTNSVYNLGLDEKKRGYGKDLEFSSSIEPGLDGYWRYLGMLIRPVWVVDE